MGKKEKERFRLHEKNGEYRLIDLINFFKYLELKIVCVSLKKSYSTVYYYNAFNFQNL